MKGYLGIDAGTQGLSVIFTDEELNVLATGEGGYEMLPNLSEGCYEQLPQDWENALSQAMQNLKSQLTSEIEVLSIGISGQMHGEVVVDKEGDPLGSARLWCDSRNEDESLELIELLGVKMPKRITSARWLWTVRNQKEKAVATRHMTTPAGYLAYRLTGQWNLGIGDAAGMFPIDQATLDYDKDLLSRFNQLVGDNENIESLESLLPAVRVAGDDGGNLNKTGGELLGLPEGIPVAPAEGDQPAALAGSLIGKAGMVSISFGTSVCANSVGDRPFDGVSNAIDHFCAPDGKPINMVWLRNGTTYMNSLVEMFGKTLQQDGQSSFEVVMPLVVEAAPDCGGLLALPFMDDEPGLGVERGGSAMIVGLNVENSTPGNTVKAGLLSTTFNLRLGSEILDNQGFPRDELVLSGGLTKSPELSQVLADVFNTPVVLLESAEEGTAWGAALLAKFRFEKIHGESRDWASFLSELSQQPAIQANRKRFEPIPSNVAIYESSYHRYRKLVKLQREIDLAVAQ